MKNRIGILLAWLGLLAGGLTSCGLEDRCEAERLFVRYDPVYVQPEVLRADISMEAPRELEDPGKIYAYGNYLLINERKAGIHIVDNRDPADPQFVSFINIPGNVDMAVRGGNLYADNWVDLLTFDISDPANPQFVSRTEEVFPSQGFDQQRGYIVEYSRTDVVEPISCEIAEGQTAIFRGGFWMIDVAFDNSRAEAGTPGQPATGIGGSLARFTLTHDRLYTVSEYDLRVFGLKEPTQPHLNNTVHIGWGIETIFPLRDNLFIGSRTGMYIMDLSQPDEPRLLSLFRHMTACDPVFVDGDVAYVTLRGGTPCENFENQLDVVDVSDLEDPQLINTFPMHHPIGLSVFQDRLYICEDDQGVKVFDATDPALVGDRLVLHQSGFAAYDVIILPDQKVAMVIGADGLYQFDVSDPDAMPLLSYLQVERP